MKAYLTITFLLTAFTTIVVCDKKSDFLQSVKSCMDEATVTEAEIKDFSAFVHSTAQLAAINPKENIKCHMKCVMEKQGVMTAGALNEETLIKNLLEWPHLKDHSSEVENAVQECKTEKGTNDCDTAFKINLCLAKHKTALASAFAAKGFTD